MAEGVKVGAVHLHRKMLRDEALDDENDRGPDDARRDDGAAITAEHAAHCPGVAHEPEPVTRGLGAPPHVLVTVRAALRHSAARVLPERTNTGIGGASASGFAAGSTAAGKLTLTSTGGAGSCSTTAGFFLGGCRM